MVNKSILSSLVCFTGRSVLSTIYVSYSQYTHALWKIVLGNDKIREGGRFIYTSLLEASFCVRWKVVHKGNEITCYVSYSYRNALVNLKY